MIYEHYGFPSLERWPESFFKDQIGHLEIAVDKAVYIPPKQRVVVPRDLSNTAIVRQQVWMKEQAELGEWVTCAEITEALGFSRKLASANITSLRNKGVKIKSRMRKGKPEYLLG